MRKGYVSELLVCRDAGIYEWTMGLEKQGVRKVAMPNRANTPLRAAALPMFLNTPAAGVCAGAGGGVVWSPVEKRWFARKCGAGAKSRHKRDELDHWGQLGHWS